MAFRTAQTASEAFSLAKNIAAGVKAIAASNASAFASTTSRDVVLSLSSNLRDFRTVLSSCAAVPGVVQYARDQYDDQEYDVAAEITAMLSAIDDVIEAIHTAFPVGAGGEIREKVLNADGSITLRTFTAGQLASLVTLLQALDAAIST